LKSANLRFWNKEDFLKRLLPEVLDGGYLWSSAERVELNEEVELNVKFVGIKENFKLGAKVIWRKAKPPGRDDLPEGVGLAFQKEYIPVLKEILRLLKLSAAENDPLKLQDERTEVRYPVNYLSEYLFEKKIITAPIKNISESGCFIETDNPLPVGTNLVFFMYRPKRPRPWVLEGEVRWAAKESPAKGMGLKLLFDSRKHKDELRRLMQIIAKGDDQVANAAQDPSMFSTNFTKTQQLQRNSNNGPEEPEAN